MQIKFDTDSHIYTCIYFANAMFLAIISILIILKMS